MQEGISLSCEIEVDASYFGGIRKSKRERVATGKVPICILKSEGKVYIVIELRIRELSYVDFLDYRACAT